MTTTTPHSSQEWKFDNDEFNDIRPGSSRYHLFRYEAEGILVYDSHSRRNDELLYEENNKIVPKEPLLENKNRKVEKNYEYDRIQYLNMRNYTSNKTIPCEYTLVIPQDSLKFESKFEGGNLRKAIRVAENEYNLLLEFDTETEGYTQWYFFAVENNKADVSIRFNIVNLMKFDSLYNDGMLPLVKSYRDGNGWKRAGYNVSYYQNSYQRPISTPNKPVFYYTLTFSYKFEHPNDKVFFAYCYPYTYSQLLAYLGSFKTHEKILKIESLCRTLGNNSCPILTITSNVFTYPSLDFFTIKQKSMYSTMKYNFKDKLKCKLVNEHSRKKGVILTGRAHPGETNSSYMMQGAIDFLLSDAKEAKILRKNFIFRIVPMLNPDGVIYGNCRCSLLGIDLNRRWKNPDEIMHPTIFYTKKMIEKFNKCHEVIMYCDMHGHSLKKNVFMYACSPNQSKKRKVLMSMIPYFLSKTNKLFSFHSTKFRTERFKQGAARVVVYKEFGIVNSYTLEASFFGPDNKDVLKSSEEEENDDTHMNIDHLQSLGRDLCKQLLMFRTQGLFKKKMDFIVNNLPKQQKHHQEIIIQEVVNEIEAEEDEDEFTILNSLQNINEEDFKELFADLDEGSESEDSGDSDIDDKKQKFFISKMNKFKKPQPLLAKTQKIVRDTRYCRSPELGNKFNRESPTRRTSYSKTTIQKKPSTPEIRKVAVVAKSYLIKDYLEYRVPSKQKFEEACHTQTSFYHYSNRLNSSRSLQRSMKDNPQGISKSNRSLKLVTISPFKERRKLMIIEPPKNFLI